MLTIRGGMIQQLLMYHKTSKFSQKLEFTGTITNFQYILLNFKELILGYGITQNIF